MKQTTKPKIPGYLYMIYIVFWAIFAVLGFEPMLIIVAVISFICATSCYDLAFRVRKNTKLAFFIGMFGGLGAWLVYFIYYQIRKRKKKAN